MHAHQQKGDYLTNLILSVTPFVGNWDYVCFFPLYVFLEWSLQKSINASLLCFYPEITVFIDHFACATH